MRTLRRLLFLVFVAALVGCGGSEKGRERPRTQSRSRGMILELLRSNGYAIPKKGRG